MAKRKTKTKTTDVATLQKLLAQYEEVFGEVGHFIELIKSQETDILAASLAANEAKAKYEEAKDELQAARESRDGTKHALFMFLRPGPSEILPLFDRMEPADEDKHGVHSDEWRKEPISALRLSLLATNLLTAADVMFVGQLQDRILASSDEWYLKIDGLTYPVAMAVADRLNDFVNERTTK